VHIMNTASTCKWTRYREDDQGMSAAGVLAAGL